MDNEVTHFTLFKSFELSVCLNLFYMFLQFSHQHLINATLTLEVGSGRLQTMVRHCLSRTFRMNEGNQGYQARRGWLERSIFNILENQENVSHELSINVSKATAGKCIRDTGAGVFTGGAVGHLAIKWTR